MNSQWKCNVFRCCIWLCLGELCTVHSTVAVYYCRSNPWCQILECNIHSFMLFYLCCCRCDTSQGWGEDHGNILSFSVWDFSGHHPAGHLTVQHQTLPVYHHWELHPSPKHQVTKSVDCFGKMAKWAKNAVWHSVNIFLVAKKPKWSL